MIVRGAEHIAHTQEVCVRELVALASVAFSKISQENKASQLDVYSIGGTQSKGGVLRRCRQSRGGC